MSDDYLDFRPIGKRQGRFHVAEPVNASSTASRRPHVRAYLEYMYPDLGHTLNREWEAANQEICRTYYFKDAKKVQAPVFDFLVDHEVWETFFCGIKSKMAGKSLVKIPKWPFRMTSEMMKNSHPSSREYTEYLNGFMRQRRKEAKREALISDIRANAARSNASSSSVPQVPLPALNPTPDVSSNDASASVSQPPSTVPHEINAETLATSLPANLSEHPQRQWFWELVGGNSTFRPPIIGPFQMKLPAHIPLNASVTGPDLQRIKSALLPRGSSLMVEISTEEESDDGLSVVLTLGFAKGYGGKVYDRVELLRFWDCMTDWLSMVYDGPAVPLYGHLLKSLVSRNGIVTTVSEGLNDLYAKHREMVTEALEEQE
ncbi:hypothetical protein H9Q74_013102 [Fusarium xylarioides]|nr:hypothetical protein H9Q71_013178 [Fusarium xylarioides]KAG5812498.1 hypothetical protein H9Q74_013102 [Fusarium xylarioides]